MPEEEIYQIPNFVEQFKFRNTMLMFASNLKYNFLDFHETYIKEGKGDKKYFDLKKDLHTKLMGTLESLRDVCEYEFKQFLNSIDLENGRFFL